MYHIFSSLARWNSWINASLKAWPLSWCPAICFLVYNGYLLRAWQYGGRQNMFRRSGLGKSKSLIRSYISTRIFFVLFCFVCIWPNQWETALQCNAVPRWLGPYPEWSLIMNMIHIIKMRVEWSLIQILLRDTLSIVNPIFNAFWIGESVKCLKKCYLEVFK